MTRSIVDVACPIYVLIKGQPYRVNGILKGSANSKHAANAVCRLRLVAEVEENGSGEWKCGIEPEG